MHITNCNGTKCIYCVCAVKITILCTAHSGWLTGLYSCTIELSGWLVDRSVQLYNRTEWLVDRSVQLYNRTEWLVDRSVQLYNRTEWLVQEVCTYRKQE